MKFISEQIYYITYIRSGCSYECDAVYLASCIEEAIAMAREEEKHNKIFIKEVRAGSTAKRKSTKSITIDV